MTIINPHNWYGYLTIENITDVAQAIHDWIGTRRYTFVAVNDALTSADVRTDQYLRPEKTFSRKALSVHIHEDNQFAHFSFSDTYGVWGCSTHARDGQRESFDKQPYLSFRYGRELHIQHYAPAGNKLYWVIALQKEGGAS